MMDVIGRYNVLGGGFGGYDVTSSPYYGPSRTWGDPAFASLASYLTHGGPYGGGYSTYPGFEHYNWQPRNYNPYYSGGYGGGYGSYGYGGGYGSYAYGQGSFGGFGFGYWAGPAGFNMYMGGPGFGFVWGNGPYNPHAGSYTGYNYGDYRYPNNYNQNNSGANNSSPHSERAKSNPSGSAPTSTNKVEDSSSVADASEKTDAKKDEKKTPWQKETSVAEFRNFLKKGKFAFSDVKFDAKKKLITLKPAGGAKAAAKLWDKLNDMGEQFASLVRALPNGTTLKLGRQAQTFENLSFANAPELYAALEGWKPANDVAKGMDPLKHNPDIRNFVNKYSADGKSVDKPKIEIKAVDSGFEVHLSYDPSVDKAQLKKSGAKINAVLADMKKIAGRWGNYTFFVDGEKLTKENLKKAEFIAAVEKVETGKIEASGAADTAGGEKGNAGAEGKNAAQAAPESAEAGKTTAVPAKSDDDKIAMVKKAEEDFGKIIEGVKKIGMGESGNPKDRLEAALNAKNSQTELESFKSGIGELIKLTAAIKIPDDSGSLPKQDNVDWAAKAQSIAKKVKLVSDIFADYETKTSQKIASLKDNAGQTVAKTEAKVKPEKADAAAKTEAVATSDAKTSLEEFKAELEKYCSKKKYAYVNSPGLFENMFNKGMTVAAAKTQLDKWNTNISAVNKALIRYDFLEKSLKASLNTPDGIDVNVALKTSFLNDLIESKTDVGELNNLKKAVEYGKKRAAKVSPPEGDVDLTLSWQQQLVKLRAKVNSVSKALDDASQKVDERIVALKDSAKPASIAEAQKAEGPKTPEKEEKYAFLKKIGIDKGLSPDDVDKYIVWFATNSTKPKDAKKALIKWAENIALVKKGETDLYALIDEIKKLGFIGDGNPMEVITAFINSKDSPEALKAIKGDVGNIYVKLNKIKLPLSFDKAVLPPIGTDWKKTLENLRNKRNNFATLMVNIQYKVDKRISELKSAVNVPPVEPAAPKGAEPEAVKPPQTGEATPIEIDPGSPDSPQEIIVGGYKLERADEIKVNTSKHHQFVILPEKTTLAQVDATLAKFTDPANLEEAWVYADFMEDGKKYKTLIECGFKQKEGQASVLLNIPYGLLDGTKKVDTLVFYHNHPQVEGLEQGHFGLNPISSEDVEMAFDVARQIFKDHEYQGDLEFRVVTESGVYSMRIDKEIGKMSKQVFEMRKLETITKYNDVISDSRIASYQKIANELNSDGVINTEFEYYHKEMKAVIDAYFGYLKHMKDNTEWLASHGGLGKAPYTERKKRQEETEKYLGQLKKIIKTAEKKGIKHPLIDAFKAHIESRLQTIAAK